MQTDKEKIKELEAKIGQIREHTKNFPTLEEGKITEVWKLKSWKDRLVGLLGQKEEKPQPKKEEKP